LNGNPNSAQKRFHDDLRLMYFETQHHNGIGELHHLFGSKAKFKLLSEAGIDKGGEWLIIMIPKTVHDDIKEYGFEYERGTFLSQQREYQSFFGKPSPIPEEVIEYMKLLPSKHAILKTWS